MNASYGLKIEDMENYLNTIFDLQSKLMDKDFKIGMLQFELDMEKQMVAFIKRIYVPAQTTVN